MPDFIVSDFIRLFTTFIAFTQECMCTYIYVFFSFIAIVCIYLYFMSRVYIYMEKEIPPSSLSSEVQGNNSNNEQSIHLELFHQAHLAKHKAYCPYSKFRYRF